MKKRHTQARNRADSPSLNWEESYARLAKAGRALESEQVRSPEKAEELLRTRAAALAKPHEEAAEPAELLDLVVFPLAGERYGVEAEAVVEVLPKHGLTPVPSMSAFVAGILNLRGRILTVVDLRRFLDLPGDQTQEGGQVVAVTAAGMTFGLLAEGPTGFVRVGAHDLRPSPVSLTKNRPAFLRGVTKEMLLVLDLEGLTRAPGFLINEEVG